MKYEITHICGHNQEHQLYGAETERKSKLAWLAGQPCANCRQSAASAAAENSNLPALSGSDKQVAWAVTIRQAAIDLMVSDLGANGFACPEDVAAAVAGLPTTAGWWIDNREINKGGEWGRKIALGHKDEFKKIIENAQKN